MLRLENQTFIFHLALELHCVVPQKNLNPQLSLSTQVYTTG